jgi:hypothetical protein
MADAVVGLKHHGLSASSAALSARKTNASSRRFAKRRDEAGDGEDKVPCGILLTGVSLTIIQKVTLTKSVIHREVRAAIPLAGNARVTRDDTSARSGCASPAWSNPSTPPNGAWPPPSTLFYWLRNRLGVGELTIDILAL